MDLVYAETMFKWVVDLTKFPIETYESSQIRSFPALWGNNP